MIDRKDMMNASRLVVQESAWEQFKFAEAWQ